MNYLQPKNASFSLAKRVKSFTYAFQGLRTLFSEEHNARIHLVSAFIAVVAGWWLRISEGEWIALALCICAVFVAEIFNTALENLADFISPGQNPVIGRIKDLCAAAVLICALTAVTTGMIIFLPKLVVLF